MGRDTEWSKVRRSKKAYKKASAQLSMQLGACCKCLELVSPLVFKAFNALFRRLFKLLGMNFDARQFAVGWQYRVKF